MKQSQSGQTLVEFALAFPLLALMLFGIIQYGFIFNNQITLRHAAQVTSRAMSLAGSSTNNIDAIAQGAIGPLLNPANLKPAVLTNPTIGGVPAVQVTLTYNMTLIIPFVVPKAKSNTLTLTATAIDRSN